MCVRITKELKQIYDVDLRIDLGQKITFPTFVEILARLGYLDRDANSMGATSLEPLTRLAWETIRTVSPVEQIF